MRPSMTLQNAGTLKESISKQAAAMNQMSFSSLVVKQTLYEELKEITPTVYIGSDNSDYIDSFNETLN